MRGRRQVISDRVDYETAFFTWIITAIAGVCVSLRTLIIRQQEQDRWTRRSLVARRRRCDIHHLLIALAVGLNGARLSDGRHGNGAEPQGLDPHVVTGVPENHIIRALFEGLAVKNPMTSEPEPGPTT